MRQEVCAVADGSMDEAESLVEEALQYGDPAGSGGGGMSVRFLSTDKLVEALTNGGQLDDGDRFLYEDWDLRQIDWDDPRLAMIPSVPDLHQQMAAIINAELDSFNMELWHYVKYDDKTEKCGTTHCRAGFVNVIAVMWRSRLEYDLGVGELAAIITCKSCRFIKNTPDFYASERAALEDIELCADIEAGRLPESARPVEEPDIEDGAPMATSLSTLLRGDKAPLSEVRMVAVSALLHPPGR